MDINQVKHDLKGGFDGVIMAMKILKKEQSHEELISLVQLSIEKLIKLRGLSSDLIAEIEEKS